MRYKPTVGTIALLCEDDSVNWPVVFVIIVREFEKRAGWSEAPWVIAQTPRGYAAFWSWKDKENFWLEGQHTIGDYLRAGADLEFVPVDNPGWHNANFDEIVPNFRPIPGLKETPRGEHLAWELGSIIGYEYAEDFNGSEQLLTGHDFEHRIQIVAGWPKSTKIQDDLNRGLQDSIESIQNTDILKDFEDPEDQADWWKDEDTRHNELRDKIRDDMHELLDDDGDQNPPNEEPDPEDEQY